MKVLVISLLLFSAAALAQTTIPAGTVFPVQLNSSLNSLKSRPGQTITARVMQEVPLSHEKKIRAGAKMIGHVVSVNPATAGKPAEITFAFTKLKLAHHSVPISIHLRSLASMMDVLDAQIPPAGTDRGTPWAWATLNLIGGEVAYGQGGPVSRGVDTVGEALEHGVVLAPLNANRSAGCDGQPADDRKPQALWVFSSDSCGVYGAPDVEITHAGRTAPVGEITLVSKIGNIEVRSGSGMLLRINPDLVASDSSGPSAPGQ
jgi:hypothetical protein